MLWCGASIRSFIKCQDLSHFPFFIEFFFPFNYSFLSSSLLHSQSPFVADEYSPAHDKCLSESTSKQPDTPTYCQLHTSPKGPLVGQRELTPGIALCPLAPKLVSPPAPKLRVPSEAFSSCLYNVLDGRACCRHMPQAGQQALDRAPSTHSPLWCHGF